MFFICLLITCHDHTLGQQKLIEDIFFHVSSTKLAFGNDEIALTFNTKHGGLESITCTGLTNILQATSWPSYQTDGDWYKPTSNTPLKNYDVRIDPDGRSMTLFLTWRIGHTDFTVMHKISPHSPTVRTALSLVNDDDAAADTVRFEGFKIEYPIHLAEKEDCHLTIPGPFFPNTFIRPHTPYDSIIGKAIRFHSAPDAGFGLILMENEKVNRAIGSWMNTNGEVNYTPYITTVNGNVSIGNEDHRFYRCFPRLTVPSDTFYISVGKRAEVLARYQAQISRALPLEKDTPAWIKKAIILEVYPAYFQGGFKEITEKLNLYKDIGFNTIYLMPHWSGGYSPLDPFKVEATYGTREELQTLIRKAHALGMRVLFDMVIHGFNKTSLVPTHHPEMFIHEPDGDLALHPTWKSISTDWASEDYHRYMTDWVLHDLRLYDIDGYRVDAASYKGPGWASNLPYPAYAPGTKAPMVMQKMLNAMRREKKEVVLLNEVFGPVFYTVSNFSHDNQTEAVEMLMEKMKNGKYTARDYVQYIKDVYAVLPVGANRVFFSRNHDTSWFYHFAGYTPLYFCFEAIHSFVGIPEVFAGDRNYPHHLDSDPTLFLQYKRLFEMRKKFPEVTTGELKWDKIQTNDDHIWCSSKEGEDGKSVLLVVNMSALQKKVTITLQSSVKDMVWHDVYNAKKIIQDVHNRQSFEITLEPYQVLMSGMKTRVK
jgi:hypothetical protein